MRNSDFARYKIEFLALQNEQFFASPENDVKKLTNCLLGVKMRVHSSTVEDVFHIEGRGCLVVPGLLLQDSPYVQIGDPATLRRPDGTTIQTRIADIVMLSPRNRECMPVLLPDDVRKSDIPIGTLLEITETYIRDNDEK